MTWQWDETLYEGSAAHYREGRLPYPPDLPERLAQALHLTGAERLLDIGCGPGNLTIPLAPHVAEAVGVDADPGMIAEARTAAPHLTWVNARAEQLTGDSARDLGVKPPFDVITFGQSFHWIDGGWARDHLRDLLAPHGVVVHLGATTHEGRAGDEGLIHPRPPHDRIEQLVRSYLGEVRRAGRSTRVPRDDEEQVLSSAGLTREAVVVVEARREWERSEREVASAVLSLSYSTPALFGDRYADFLGELDDLLRETSDDGLFSELQDDVTLALWRA